MDVPPRLFRGMSAEELKKSRKRGWIKSDPDVGWFGKAAKEIESLRRRERELEYDIRHAEDPDLRAEYEDELTSVQQEIFEFEGEYYVRENEGEYEITFFADSFDHAQMYGPMVVEIDTVASGREFTPRREGEWITHWDVPWSSVVAIHESKVVKPRLSRRTRRRVGPGRGWWRQPREHATAARKGWRRRR